MNIRKALFPLVVLLSLQSASGQDWLPRVHKGVIDLREWDFSSRGSLPLAGDWRFYWNQLALPQETATLRPAYFPFPSVWNGQHDGLNTLSGQGYATYSATVVLRNAPPVLSLELPDFYTSYQLWVNGQPIAANGEVGTSRKSSTPQWLPQTIVFPCSKDTVELHLQVSNFYHRKGGSNDHIYLGLPDQLYARREQAVITNIVLFGGLGLIGFFFLILYLFFKRDRAALYFAAICLTWALRSVLTNLYLFVNWFPQVDWELAVKLEYLTLYLTMMWGLLFIARLFPDDTNALAKYILLTINLIFILLTLATPAFTYSSLVPAYLVVAWFILAYVIVIVVRALVFERAGAWFAIGSIFLGVVMFGYDMLTYQGYWNFNPLLFNTGYLVVFFLNATAFAHQLSRSLQPPRQNMAFHFTMK